MSKFTVQNLIKFITQKDKYKQVHQYVKEVQLQNQSIYPIINQALHSILVTNTHIPTSKLYGLRFLKDLFLSAQFQLIDGLHQSILKQIVKVSQFDKDNKDKSKRGWSYFQEVEKRKKQKQLDKISYSFVLFSTEIIYVMGRWYKVDENNEETDYAMIFDRLQKLGVPFPENDKQLKFFKVEQRQLFNKNFKQWVEKLPQIQEESNEGQEKENLNQKSRKSIKSMKKVGEVNRKVEEKMAQERILKDNLNIEKKQQAKTEQIKDKQSKKEQGFNSKNTIVVSQNSQSKLQENKELIQVKTAFNHQRQKNQKLKNDISLLEQKIKQIQILLEVQKKKVFIKEQKQQILLSNKTSDLESKYNFMQNKCSSIQNKFNILQSQYQSLQKKYNELKAKNKEVQEKYLVNKKNDKNLQEKYEALQMTNKQLRKQIQNIKIKQQELILQRQSIRERLINKQNEMRKSSLQVQKMKQQKRELICRIKQQQKNIQEKRRQRQNNRDNVKEQSKKLIKQKNNDENRQQAGRQKLMQEIRRSEEKVRELQKQIQSIVEHYTREMVNLKQRNRYLQQVNERNRRKELEGNNHEKVLIQEGDKLGERQDISSQVKGREGENRQESKKTDGDIKGNDKEKQKQKEKTGTIRQISVNKVGVCGQIQLRDNKAVYDNDKKHDDKEVIQLRDNKDVYDNDRKHDDKEVSQNKQQVLTYSQKPTYVPLSNQYSPSSPILTQQPHTLIQSLIHPPNSMSKYLQQQSIKQSRSYNNFQVKKNNFLTESNQKNIQGKNQEQFKQNKKVICLQQIKTSQQKLKYVSLGKTQKSLQKMKKRRSSGKTFHFTQNQFNYLGQNNNVSNLSKKYNLPKNNRISSSYGNLLNLINSNQSKNNSMRVTQKSSTVHKKSSALLLNRKSFNQEINNSTSNKFQALIPQIENYFTFNSQMSQHNIKIFKTLCIHPQKRQNQPIYVDKLLQIKVLDDLSFEKQIFVLQIMNISYNPFTIKVVSCHDQFKILGEKKRHVKSNCTVEYQLQTKVKDLNLRYPVVSFIISENQSFHSNKNNCIYNLPLPLTLLQFCEFKDQIPNFIQVNSSQLLSFKSQFFILNTKMDPASKFFSKLKVSNKRNSFGKILKQKISTYQGTLYHRFIQNIETFIKIYEIENKMQIQFIFRSYDKLSQNFAKVMIQTLMFLLKEAF